MKIQGEQESQLVIPMLPFEDVKKFPIYHKKEEDHKNKVVLEEDDSAMQALMQDRLSLTLEQLNLGEA